MLSDRLRLHAESRPAVTTVRRPQRQSLSFAAGVAVLRWVTLSGASTERGGYELIRWL